MTYDPNRHHRRSIRLRGYDYTQAGAYYITIVCQDRTCLFGEITDGIMHLNDGGLMVQSVWDEYAHILPRRRRRCLFDHAPTICTVWSYYLKSTTLGAGPRLPALNPITQRPSPRRGRSPYLPLIPKPAPDPPRTNTPRATTGGCPLRHWTTM